MQRLPQLGGPADGEPAAEADQVAGDVADMAMVGVGAVVVKLPTVLRRLRETVDTIVAKPPDVLILIDAPDFTHRVAARVRKRVLRKNKENILKYLSEDRNQLSAREQQQVESTLKEMASRYGYCEACAKDAILFLMRKRYAV